MLAPASVSQHHLTALDVHSVDKRKSCMTLCLCTKVSETILKSRSYDIAYGPFIWGHAEFHQQILMNRALRTEQTFQPLTFDMAFAALYRDVAVDHADQCPDCNFEPCGPAVTKHLVPPCLSLLFFLMLRFLSMSVYMYIIYIQVYSRNKPIYIYISTSNSVSYYIISYYRML